MKLTLEQLNQLNHEEFTRELSEIYEHSPWISHESWHLIPFSSIEDLHKKMCGIIRKASQAQKLDLIRAHPDLAGKLAVSGDLPHHSMEEQQSAQLDKLTPEQFESMSWLNIRYKEKFGFPFVICVKDHTRESILDCFKERLKSDRKTEMDAALEQICRIAWHRLQVVLT